MNIECVRIFGDVMAAIQIQDEWTGNYKIFVRKIYSDGNRYYCNADRKRVDVTEARNQFLRIEEMQRTGLKWYKDNTRNPMFYQ